MMRRRPCCRCAQGQGGRQCRGEVCCACRCALTAQSAWKHHHSWPAGVCTIDTPCTLPPMPLPPFCFFFVPPSAGHCQAQEAAADGHRGHLPRQLGGRRHRDLRRREPGRGGLLLLRASRPADELARTSAHKHQLQLHPRLCCAARAACSMLNLARLWSLPGCEMHSLHMPGCVGRGVHNPSAALHHAGSGPLPRPAAAGGEGQQRAVLLPVRLHCTAQHRHRGLPGHVCQCRWAAGWVWKGRRRGRRPQGGRCSGATTHRGLGLCVEACSCALPGVHTLPCLLVVQRLVWRR